MSRIIFILLLSGINSQYFKNVEIQIVRDLDKVTSIHATTVEDEVNATDIIIEGQYVPKLLNGSFNNLEKLKRIKLIQDSIKEIEEGAFGNLTKLRLLSINFNGIKVIKSRVFQGLSLTALDLLANQIEEFEHGCLNSLKDLEVLNLQSNNITQLPSELLSGLTNLKILNLSFNKIQAIPDNFFDGVFATGVPNTVLDLSNNKLEYLSRRAVEGFREIGELHLNNNELKAIDYNVFKNLKVVHHLDLEGNALNTLSQTMLSHLQGTENVNVFANPWNCDFIKRYMAWLKTTGIPLTVDLNMLVECWP